jgi:hypothetical protein
MGALESDSRTFSDPAAWIKQLLVAPEEGAHQTLMVLLSEVQ